MMMPVRVRCVRSLPPALLMPKSSTFTVTACTSPASNGVARRLEQHDVLGLHVPMDDPARMRRGERAAHLTTDGGGHARLERSLALHVRRELLALDELADEVGRSVREVVDVEHVDDVRVRERARALRLAHEPGDDLVVRCEVGVERLDGEATLLQAEVPRLVHSTHAAFADDADDLVRLAEELADEGIDGRVGRGDVDERARVARAHDEVGRVTCLARRAAAA